MPPTIGLAALGQPLYICCQRCPVPISFTSLDPPASNTTLPGARGPSASSPTAAQSSARRPTPASTQTSSRRCSRRARPWRARTSCSWSRRWPRASWGPCRRCPLTPRSTAPLCLPAPCLVRQAHPQLPRPLGQHRPALPAWRAAAATAASSRRLAAWALAPAMALPRSAATCRRSASNPSSQVQAAWPAPPRCTEATGPPPPLPQLQQRRQPQLLPQDQRHQQGVLEASAASAALAPCQHRSGRRWVPATLPLQQRRQHTCLPPVLMLASARRPCGSRRR